MVTFVSSSATTKLWLQNNEKKANWSNWLAFANQALWELTVLLELILEQGFANSDKQNSDENNYKEFDIEELAHAYSDKLAESYALELSKGKATKLAHQYEKLITSIPEHLRKSQSDKVLDAMIYQTFSKGKGVKVDKTPNDLLTEMSQLKKFAVIEMSRLDDGNDSLFFIGSNHKATNYGETAYANLKQHYQGRCMRIHLLYHWLQEEKQTQKDMIEDYFRLPLEKIVKKHLPTIDATSPYIKDYTQAILPEYFNEQQTQIVKESSRASMVLAGPGSGKTTVVVHRVAHLLIMEEIKPEKILVLAYNRMAVKELRERLHVVVQ